MNKPWHEVDADSRDTMPDRPGDAVQEALGSLAREYRAIAAPVGLESRLREAANAGDSADAARHAALANATQRQAHRLDQRVWTLALSAAAVLLVGLALWTAQRRFSGVSLTKPVRGVASTPAETGQQPERTAKTPAKKLKASPHAARQASPAHDDDESAMLRGFMPLPGSEGLPDPYEATVVRVEMSKGQLEQYGFHVPPAVEAELIRADFFVGEDGLPRGIRLVR
jgi:hypothetical protein